jgi:hypothetical protein
MGYDTYFKGKLKFDKPLSEKDRELVMNLHATRRYKRPVDEKIYGKDGEFYFGSEKENTDPDFYSTPPNKQPSVWNRWLTDEKGEYYFLDNDEKIYFDYEWIVWMMENIFIPKGYVLNGAVFGQGEEVGDLTLLIVKNNKIEYLSFDQMIKEEYLKELSWL